LFDHLKKFTSPTTQFVVQIDIFVDKVIARTFEYIPLLYMKIASFRLANEISHE